MKLGIEKWFPNLKRQGEKGIRSVNECEGYKYLRVTGKGGILHEQMEEKNRNVTQSKLKGGNVMKAVNAWEVSLVRYAG